LWILVDRFPWSLRILADRCLFVQVAMIERIRELLEAADFLAFTIKLANGRSIVIPTRRHAWVSPYGRLVIETGASHLEVFQSDELAGVDVERAIVREVC
jgi:hypothetical protein